MLYWISLLIIFAVLLLEKRSLERRRAAIPLRVHVHGTRGKSSTVRLLAAELRTMGFRVLAKTTGDAPEYILPDGSTEPIRRFGPARISEHVRIFCKAEQLGADALVVEGMALQPETVWQSQTILQATHAVITNVRPDHAETMGEGMEGPASTLALMAAPGRPLYTGDEPGAGLLAQHVVRTTADAPRLVAVPSMHFLDQPRDLARALAQDIRAADTTLPSDDDRDAMPGTAPAPMRLLHSPSLSFLDLFSANDVASARMLCETAVLQGNSLKIALLSTRADRPLRTRDFLDWLAEGGFHAVIPMGSHAPFAQLYGRRIGLRMMPVWPFLSPEKLFEKLSRIAAGHQGMLVVGLGNAHGFGERWRDICRRIGGQ